jgi:hypothetical protein
MPTAPAKLQFVSSLLTSKIFWAQVVTVIALILSASGVHVLDDPAVQAQLIAAIDAIVTIVLRLYSSGPVSLTGPISTPPSQDVPVGASVVAVPAPKDPTQITAVVPLDAGTHTVDVVAHPTAGPVAVPATVIVTPVP